MVRLLTAEEMREIEGAAMESGRATGRDLMERAGVGAVDAILSQWPGLSEGRRRAVVLCGPGNNGGDGFVVARVLVRRGWSAAVLTMAEGEDLPPNARMHHDHWKGLGPMDRLTEAAVEDVLDADNPPDLVVDALFGTGLSRPLAMPLVADTLDALVLSEKAKVVALDMPSGWCADSGRWLGEVEEGFYPSRADLTVAFHAPKLGHYLGDAPQACGHLRVVDIGIARTPDGTTLVEAPPAHRVLKRVGHKYGHGHALVIGGEKAGAARMAARGALRIGAGLVTLGLPGAVLAANAARLDAIMTTEVGDAEALETLLEDGRVNALCLGPGLGRGEGTRAMVASVLATGRGAVLDADALTSFEDDPKALFAMLHRRAVLTPHMGEFARLFPDLAAELDAPAQDGPAVSVIDVAREAAVRAGCTVLLKGPGTVIATPKSAAVHGALYERAAPWLATAGSGDTLAGFITGLLARGEDPLFAASAAAWLHAECAIAFGPGLIAEDLPEMLPKVFSRLA